MTINPIQIIVPIDLHPPIRLSPSLHNAEEEYGILIKTPSLDFEYHSTTNFTELTADLGLISINVPSERHHSVM